MQPSPNGDTSIPLLPSTRFFTFAMYDLLVQQQNRFLLSDGEMAARAAFWSCWYALRA